MHGTVTKAADDDMLKYAATRRSRHTVTDDKTGLTPRETPSDVIYTAAEFLMTVNHKAPQKVARQTRKKRGSDSADSLIFLRTNKRSISSLHTKRFIENNLWIYIISVYSQYNTIFQCNQGFLKKMMIFVNYVDILCKLYYVNQSTNLRFRADYAPYKRNIWAYNSLYRTIYRLSYCIM